MPKTSPYRRTKGIVFDLDGTLVDSLGITFDAFNFAFVQLGGSQLTPAQISAYFGTGESQIFGKILGEHQAEAAYGIYRNYINEHLSRVPLHPGVEVLLENLKSAEVPISIFTGRSWETTQLILEHHQVLDRFITVVANDHVANPKPAPDGLLLALSRMKLDPADVYLVGDSPMDILAAKKAGSLNIAALWDQGAQRSLLEGFEPDHFAENPLAVWEIFNR